VTGRKEKFTNAHLPSGSQDNGAWRRIFIPTYLQYLASRDSDSESDKDAWALNDDEAVSIQQKIWDFVYGNKVPHIITVQGPVFALVGVPELPVLLPTGSTSILITHLPRSINVFVNGVADLLPLPCLLSMLSLMTTSMILMSCVKTSQFQLWNPGHFYIVMFPLPRRMAR
jgi:hypothetical protein